MNNTAYNLTYQQVFVQKGAYSAFAIGFYQLNNITGSNATSKNPTSWLIGDLLLANYEVVFDGVNQQVGFYSMSSSLTLNILIIFFLAVILIL